MKRLLAALALAPLVVACSESPTSWQSPTPPVAQSFDISSAPPQTGVVLRSAWPDPFIWGVPSAGLEVVMGTEAGEFCQLWNGGAGDPSPAFLSVMTYADKNLFDRVLTIGQDRETPTQVWPYAGATLEAFCASVLSGAQPIATGVTSGKNFFSDIGATGNGADVAFWSYHGHLTRSDGNQAVFSFQMHWRQWAPTKVTATLR